MARDKDRPRTEDNSDFLATPMYRLVDRHRPILEKIRTREDAEYWGHMLIVEWYPEVPSSRAASGKLAALVGLTDYLDFYCRDGITMGSSKTGRLSRRLAGSSESGGSGESKNSRTSSGPRSAGGAKAGRGP